MLHRSFLVENSGYGVREHRIIEAGDNYAWAAHLRNSIDHINLLGERLAFRMAIARL
jgi:hypothetical protein